MNLTASFFFMKERRAETTHLFLPSVPARAHFLFSLPPRRRRNPYQDSISIFPFPSPPLFFFLREIEVVGKDFYGAFSFFFFLSLGREIVDDVAGSRFFIFDRS